MRDLLPIGSVVKLKEMNSLVMVYGRFYNDTVEKKIYHYLACLYPEGSMGKMNNYKFNHDDIEEIFFIGLKNELEIKLKKEIKEKIFKGE